MSYVQVEREESEGVKRKEEKKSRSKRIFEGGTADLSDPSGEKSWRL
jgi:hypothetical protein